MKNYLLVLSVGCFLGSAQSYDVYQFDKVCGSTVTLNEKSPSGVILLDRAVPSTPDKSCELTIITKAENHVVSIALKGVKFSDCKASDLQIRGFDDIVDTSASAGTDSEVVFSSYPHFCGKEIISDDPITVNQDYFNPKITLLYKGSNVTQPDYFEFYYAIHSLDDEGPVWPEVTTASALPQTSKQTSTTESTSTTQTASKTQSTSTTVVTEAQKPFTSTEMTTESSSNTDAPSTNQSQPDTEKPSSIAPEIDYTTAQQEEVTTNKFTSTKKDEKITTPARASETSTITSATEKTASKFSTTNSKEGMESDSTHSVVVADEDLTTTWARPSTSEDMTTSSTPSSTRAQTSVDRETTGPSVAPVDRTTRVKPAVPAKPADNRRCHCSLRAANARTNWTFLKHDLEDVLDSNDVEAHVTIPFSQKPTQCSEVAAECSAHCQSVGAKYFGAGHQSQLSNRRTPVSVGDYVCGVLKWTKKFVKVVVTSEAVCTGLRGNSRYVRRQPAFTLIKDLCCKNVQGKWIGSRCYLDVIG